MEILVLLFVLFITVPILSTGSHGNPEMPYECKYSSSDASAVDTVQGCPEMCSCSLSHTELTMKCVNKNLTTIPSPPKSKKIKTVKMLFLCNHLESVTNDTFVNLTSVKLTYLSLLYNNISYLDPYAFNNLRHLHGLDLSLNPRIGMPRLVRCFDEMSHIPLTKINMSRMEIMDTNLTRNTFRGFREKSNFQIIMMNNKLTYYPYEALETVTKLTYIDLDGNPINTFSPPDNYTQEHLLQIDFDNNYFPVFPNFCKSNKSKTFFPSLIKLKIRWNFMRLLDPERYNCLDTLQDIRLNGNAMKVLQSNQFAGLRSLENITLSYMDYNLRKIQDAPFNNSNIKNIYFRKNNLWFRRNDRNLKLFEGCSSLQLLNLCDNFMGHMTEDNFETLLSPVASSVYELILGGCGLTWIPKVISTKFINLVNLVIYRNSISDIPLGTFDKLKFLDTIRLANNQLSIITAKTFPVSFRQRAKVVELAYNPFSCMCDLRWFIGWVRDNRHTHLFATSLKELLHGYKCTSPENLNDKPLLDIHMSENECLLGLQEKITTLAVSCIMIFILVVVSVGYRCRWQVRYWCYMFRYKQRQDLDTGDKDYDAFVSFSKQDRPWVVEKLLPVLEEGGRLKICVHDRDFLGGKLVIDNIVDGIEKSRQVIVVVSNAFAQSKWCQFEMNLVQHRALEHDQRLLVVVLLEEVDSSHMTKALKAMLQTTTYLMWGEEEFAKKAFFNRLRMMLQKSCSTENKRRLSV